MSNQEIESPCVGICVVDDEDICEGCGRSMDEIAGWLHMSNAEREQAIRHAMARLKMKAVRQAES